MDECPRGPGGGASAHRRRRSHAGPSRPPDPNCPESSQGTSVTTPGVTQPPRWRSRCRSSPAEGGADVCWTRANADRDEVGQLDLADRRPRSANREAEAVTGLQSPAATPSRSTFVTRLLAGLDEPRPRPHRRARRVVYVADRRDPAARPRASPNAFRARDVHRAVAAPTPREKPPPERVSFRA